MPPDEPDEPHRIRDGATKLERPPAARRAPDRHGSRTTDDAGGDLRESGLQRAGANRDHEVALALQRTRLAECDLLCAPPLGTVHGHEHAGPATWRAWKEESRHATILDDTGLDPV